MNTMQGKQRRSLCALLVAASLLLPLGAQAQSAPSGKSAPRVALKTSEGVIVIELAADKAPVTVENFLAYVRKGHYNGSIFHRVVDDFMIQGGGFNRAMVEIPVGPPIRNEANNGLLNERGTIAMARTADIDSATAQFFINVGNKNGYLNHIPVPPEGTVIERGGRRMRINADQARQVYGYAVFGKVVEGMDVVDKIKLVPTAPVGPHQHVPLKPVVIESATILKP